LNEEKFQETRKKFIIVGLVIMAIGLAIGGSLIVKGFVNKDEVYTKYTEENKQKKIAALNEKYEALEEEIYPELDKIKELEREKTGELYHNDKDRFYAIEDEIEAIKKEIEPIEAKIRSLGIEIRSAENESVGFQRSFNSKDYIPLFMFGGFICFVSLMIGGTVIAQAYRRNMLAYRMQAVMPVAKEGIEEMTPVMGDVAEEISEKVTRGIKKGLSDKKPKRSNKKKSDSK
jgi:hypothetical protein